jgi:hypothetical protein
VNCPHQRRFNHALGERVEQFSVALHESGWE